MVGSLLSSLSFTPTKRYEEVDGVRKEKERLTTDHLSPRGEDWSLTFRFLVHVLIYINKKIMHTQGERQYQYIVFYQPFFYLKQIFEIPF